MKILLYTFLACLIASCVGNKKEERTEITKDEPIASKEDTPQPPKAPEKKPTLSKEDSIKFHTELSPQIVPQKRDIIELLQESDSVVVISHERLFSAKTVGDSIKAVKERIALTPEQRILFAKTLNKNAKIIIRQIKGNCWDPHHKVYFYTKQGVAWWWICFDCGQYQSEGISFSNTSKIDLEENGTIAQLFKKFGLTYQL